MFQYKTMDLAPPEPFVQTPVTAVKADLKGNA